MAKAFKLSSGQAKILRRLNAGDKLGYIGGMHSHYFWYKKKPGEVSRIQHSTIHILEKQGLIEDHEKPAWRWRGSNFGITTKGKELLCQIDATKG